MSNGQQPPNSSISGSQWFCNAGYEKAGNECISIFAKNSNGQRTNPPKIDSGGLTAANESDRLNKLESEKRLAKQKASREDELKRQAELKQKRRIARQQKAERLQADAARKMQPAKEGATAKQKQDRPQSVAPISGGLPPLNANGK